MKEEESILTLQRALSEIISQQPTMSAQTAVIDSE